MARETRVLVDGFHFGEGPRWREGRLWFSDFQAHAVRSVSLAGDLRTEFEIDDQPSGMGWMPDGSLLVVSMKKRQLLRRTPDGKISLHADLSGVADGNCNDMVVDAQGRAYVGNFGYDLEARMAARGAGQAFADAPMAKLALVDVDGRVSVAAEGMHFPNGSVITPDGRTLIVAESMSSALTAFDVGADGRLSNRRCWAQTGEASPDGISLDAEGAIWVANPRAQECLRIAEGGKVLEVVDPGESCFACMLGGDDGRTLFMLAAERSASHQTAGTPTGRVVIANVDAPRAGFP
jgi:sugar lactone lactonase YvrE